MKHPYEPYQTLSTYQQEQTIFAKMKVDEQMRKRQRRRRQIVKWVLRKLI